jgi:hypothetical protein
MRKEEILFDMDEALLSTTLSSMTDADFDAALKSLEKRKLLKKVKRAGEFHWIKSMPKRKTSLIDKVSKIFNMDS